VLPASGVDETELLDGRSLLKKLSEYFIGNNSFHNMPRKFKASSLVVAQTAPER